MIRLMGKNLTLTYLEWWVKAVVACAELLQQNCITDFLNSLSDLIDLQNCLSFLVSCVEEGPRRPIQSLRNGRKKKAKS